MSKRILISESQFKNYLGFLLNEAKGGNSIVEKLTTIINAERFFNTLNMSLFEDTDDSINLLQYIIGNYAELDKSGNGSKLIKGTFDISPFARKVPDDEKLQYSDDDAEEFCQTILMGNRINGEDNVFFQKYNPEMANRTISQVNDNQRLIKKDPNKERIAARVEKRNEGYDAAMPSNVNLHALNFVSNVLMDESLLSEVQGMGQEEANNYLLEKLGDNYHFKRYMIMINEVKRLQCGYDGIELYVPVIGVVEKLIKQTENGLYYDRGEKNIAKIQSGTLAPDDVEKQKKIISGKRQIVKDFQEKLYELSSSLGSVGLNFDGPFTIASQKPMVLKRKSNFVWR